MIRLSDDYWHALRPAPTFRRWSLYLYVDEHASIRFSDGKTSEFYRYNDTYFHRRPLKLHRVVETVRIFRNLGHEVYDEHGQLIEKKKPPERYIKWTGYLPGKRPYLSRRRGPSISEYLQGNSKWNRITTWSSDLLQDLVWSQRLRTRRRNDKMVSFKFMKQLVREFDYDLVR